MDFPEYVLFGHWEHEKDQAERTETGRTDLQLVYRPELWFLKADAMAERRAGYPGFVCSISQTQPQKAKHQ